MQQEIICAILSEALWLAVKVTWKTGILVFFWAQNVKWPLTFQAMPSLLFIFQFYNEVYFFIPLSLNNLNIYTFVGFLSLKNRKMGKSVNRVLKRVQFWSSPKITVECYLKGQVILLILVIMDIFLLKIWTICPHFRKRCLLFIILDAFQEKMLINFGKNPISSRYPISPDPVALLL